MLILCAFFVTVYIVFSLQFVLFCLFVCLFVFYFFLFFYFLNGINNLRKRFVFSKI